jgi:hypothetical protein
MQPPDSERQHFESAKIRFIEDAALLAAARSVGAFLRFKL